MIKFRNISQIEKLYPFVKAVAGTDVYNGDFGTVTEGTFALAANAKQVVMNIEVGDDEGKEIEKKSVIERGCINDEQAIKMVMEGNKATVSAINKLYKIGLFDKVKYPVGKLTEDAFVIVELLMQTKKELSRKLII